MSLRHRFLFLLFLSNFLFAQTIPVDGLVINDGSNPLALAQDYQEQMMLRDQEYRNSRALILNDPRTTPEQKIELLRANAHEYNTQATLWTAQSRVPMYNALAERFPIATSEGKPPIVYGPNGQAYLNDSFGAASDFDAAIDANRVDATIASLQAEGWVVTRRPRSFDIRPGPNMAGGSVSGADFIQVTVNITPQNAQDVTAGAGDIETYTCIGTCTVFGVDADNPLDRNANQAMNNQRVLDNAAKNQAPVDYDANNQPVNTFANESQVSTQLKSVYKNLDQTSDQEIEQMLRDNNVTNALTNAPMTASEYRALLSENYAKNNDMAMLSVITGNNLSGLLNAGTQLTNNIVERTNQSNQQIRQEWQTQIDAMPEGPERDRQQSMLNTNDSIVSNYNDLRSQSNAVTPVTPGNNNATSNPVTTAPVTSPDANGNDPQRRLPGLMSYAEFANRSANGVLGRLYSGAGMDFNAQANAARDANNTRAGRVMSNVNNAGIALLVADVAQQLGDCPEGDATCIYQRLAVAGFDFLTDELKDELIAKVSPVTGSILMAWNAGQLVGSLANKAMANITVDERCFTNEDNTETCYPISAQSALQEKMISMMGDAPKEDEVYRADYVRYYVTRNYDINRELFSYYEVSVVEMMAHLDKFCEGDRSDVSCATREIDFFVNIYREGENRFSAEENEAENTNERSDTNPTFDELMALDQGNAEDSNQESETMAATVSEESEPTQETPSFDDIMNMDEDQDQSQETITFSEIENDAVDRSLVAGLIDQETDNLENYVEEPGFIRSAVGATASAIGSGLVATANVIGPVIVATGEVLSDPAVQQAFQDFSDSYNCIEYNICDETDNAYDSGGSVSNSSGGGYINNGPVVGSWDEEYDCTDNNSPSFCGFMSGDDFGTDEYASNTPNTNQYVQNSSSESLSWHEEACRYDYGDYYQRYTNNCLDYLELIDLDTPGGCAYIQAGPDDLEPGWGCFERYTLYRNGVYWESTGWEPQFYPFECVGNGYSENYPICEVSLAYDHPYPSQNLPRGHRTDQNFRNYAYDYERNCTLVGIIDFDRYRCGPAN